MLIEVQLNLLTLLLIPPALLASYALYRILAGRPLRPAALNIISALLLGLYFFTTAGLGIFWVANQELPVFDLHYLFGYLTLIAVVVHLLFNRKQLSAWLRRPAALTRPMSSTRGRHGALRVLGWTVLFALFGTACYWLGLQHRSETIEITRAVNAQTADPLPAPPERVAEAKAIERRADAAAAGPPAARLVDPEPAPAAPAGDPLATEFDAEDAAGSMIPLYPGPSPPEPLKSDVATAQQFVRDGDEEYMLYEYYHRETKHTRLSVMQRTGGLDWSTQPEVFKPYPAAESIPLPAPLELAGRSTGEAIEAARSAVLDFIPQAITLEELSTLLYMTNGVTRMVRYPGLLHYLRAAPSAGALYPTVTYLVVRDVAGLEPGLYHYDVRSHALNLLRSEHDLYRELAALTADPLLIEHAPVTFVFSTIFFRSSWKYKDRAYRYCLLDAGHLAVQTALTAAALEMDSVPVGRFDDVALNSLLSLEEGMEGALLLLPVGRPAGATDSAIDTNGFFSRPRELNGDAHQLVRLMHGNTYLQLSGDVHRQRSATPPLDKPYSDSARIPLPAEYSSGDDLLATIRRRRSARRWQGVGLQAEQLSSLLYYSLGMSGSADQALYDPSVEGLNAVRLYLIINQVEGITPGIYYYERNAHRLVAIHEGDFSEAGHASALFQDVVGQAAVVPIMTLDSAALSASAADRGYRYAVLDAGMLGGRLYLQAVGLELGCTGIGAFFDDEVSRLIDSDPTAELIIYMAAIGMPSGDESRGAQR